MIAKRLEGKKIAVFVENKFIPEEIEAYRIVFSLLRAEVVFVSRLWYGDYKPENVIFYSDVDPLDNAPWESPHRLEVKTDISTVEPENFAAVIMSANYTSVRLRWENIPTPFDPVAYIKTPPIVKFFAKAMENPKVVKGALCHGLWILTPNPHLLKNRKVTCHSVVMADIINCGAQVSLSQNGIVVDEDLVTGFSKHEVVPFIEAIANQITALSN
jgi:protease I